MMRIIFNAILLWIPLFLTAQSQDIEVLEERLDSQIKLFAVNNTQDELEITFTADLTGFTTTEANPVKKILKPTVKEFLMTLTAPPGVDCEYKTSVSYKKIKNANNKSAVGGTKKRMTSIQMNTNKVNVFTQDGCARCEMVIEFLEKHQIPYVELNTTIHDPNQELMFTKLQEAGFKERTVQMPVIVNNGKTDFNIKDLPAYLAKLK